MTLLLQRPVTAATAEVVVECEGVTHLHRNRRGVGPVSLRIRPGEVVAVMGPNGSGKTTLLRLLSGLLLPQRGSVRWWSSPMRAATRRRVGVAFDSDCEEASLTGAESVHFWARQWLHDRTAARDATAAILAALELDAYAAEPVGSYSFGMQRRLSLATALVSEPALALLDEPTAGLDPRGVALLADLLAARRDRGLSTVIAGNDTGLIEGVADRVAFIESGRLVRCATVDELIAELPAERLAELEVGDPEQVRAAIAQRCGRLATLLDGGILRVSVDAAVLPAVVAAADACGGLRRLHLQQPGLADCFMALTGRPLGNGP